MKAYFDTGAGRRLGKVVKDNARTIWVKMMIGAKTNVTIKRHIIKHDVIFRDNAGRLFRRRL